MILWGNMFTLSILSASSIFYCFLDTGVSTTSTNIPVHGIFNFLIRWTWILFQKCTGIHDLSCLTVTALVDVFFNPCFLNRVISIF
eukprot:m.480756 g.480756  ORF g.480756 m.480756 type:complete len:86 (-) comp54035_c0_seq1:241-498(-)